MENTKNYLQVLSESLDKKTAILDKLEALTLQQKEIARAEEFDDDAFDANTDAKAKLIAELEKLDSGFQILYDNIKAQITGNKELYRQEIEALQAKISMILDKNAALLVEEENDRKLIASRFASLKKEVYQIKKSRDMAASYYKNMNNISSEAYFYDSKK
ncbi:MAG: flagellar protein FliT [Butyrivibrio sp.]|nr:flagellar protein FliT [Butyrivibrio sp.]